MDNKKIGQFIAELRKEQRLTQRELAEKLHVTDKAVSKWERGLSYPDVSLLLALAEILGVTVGELLNGERAQTPQPEAEGVVDSVFHYAEEASASRLRGWQGLAAVLFSASCLLAVLICIICDAAINGSLSWSYYPLASVVFGWGVIFPLVLKGRRGIVWSLLTLTVTILPFFWLLKALTGNPMLWSIALRMSILSLGYLWLVFLLFKFCKRRRLAAAGFSCLLGIVLFLFINGSLSQMIGGVFLDIWDLLTFGVLAASALGCFLLEKRR